MSLPFRRAASCRLPVRSAILMLAALLGTAHGGLSDTVAVTARDGTVLARLALAEGSGLCLHWNHSVTGGKVADCFANRAGQLMLESSFLHDYAAGLGDLPGRGTLRAAQGGGYVIEDIAEPMAGNRLLLRVAAPRVAQELRGDFGRIPLLQLADHQARVALTLIVGTDDPSDVPTH